MAYPIATLDANPLPDQFSYQPYMPKKRNSTTATANAVVIQSANPAQIVHGEEFLEWEIQAASPEDFALLVGLYDTAAPVLYTFIGYWGESLSVYFTRFDPPKVKSRLFSLKGAFQVVDVLVEYNPECTV